MLNPACHELYGRSAGMEHAGWLWYGQLDHAVMYQQTSQMQARIVII